MIYLLRLQQMHHQQQQQTVSGVSAPGGDLHERVELLLEAAPLVAGPSASSASTRLASIQEEQGGGSATSPVDIHRLFEAAGRNVRDLNIVRVEFETFDTFRDSRRTNCLGF